MRKTTPRLLTIALCALAFNASARFVSADPVQADPNAGQNFNRYWYGNNNPYRFTDPDGRLSRGTGWTDKQWKQFDRAQQSAAGSLEKAAGKITGAMAEPTTEPRPVENRLRWLPQAISSAISALSLMFGKPKSGSPSGTTSSR